jgi:type II secretory pathway pseudopilin PulG
MILHPAPKNEKRKRLGFTLIEISVAFFIFGMVVSGMIYGYVQINRMAEWCSMSLAAQSFASQGLEQARSAEWDYEMWPVTNGPGTGDPMGFTWLNGTTTAGNGSMSYYTTNTMDIPTSGAPIYVTNFVTISNVYSSIINIPVRQITSQCVWFFPLIGQVCTNTAVSLRAPDQ